jgi:hypothetical protein
VSPERLDRYADLIVRVGTNVLEDVWQLRD